MKTLLFVSLWSFAILMFIGHVEHKEAQARTNELISQVNDTQLNNLLERLDALENANEINK